MNYSAYGYRINQISVGTGYNWLFFPGGPGLGSEYLVDFSKKLNLPGNVFIIDFPKDGNNDHGELNLSLWQEGMIDLLQSFENPIVVTHSFAGMFVLNQPELEPYIHALVLMNTTTSNTFFPHVNAMRQRYNLPDLVPKAGQYHLNPTSETYKAFWQDYKYYCFFADELAAGEEMMSLFAFNSEAYYFAIEDFYPIFACRWIPQHIPTMTLSSEYDFICPPSVFLDDERFANPTIVNHLIKGVGHCPWLNGITELKICFTDFIKKLENL